MRRLWLPRQASREHLGKLTNRPVLKFKDLHLCRDRCGGKAQSEQNKKQGKEQLQSISNDHDES
jgi:hypothetical protein